IYMRGGVEAIKLQAGFYGGARTPAEQTAVYRCLLRDFPVLSAELPGLRVLAIQGGNLPNVITRDRQVRTLKDLKGLRLRTPAELSPLLRRLGAEPVTMPMGEVYSALSKGVVDGVVAPADTIKSLHFSEVARYLNLLQVSRGAYASRAISDRAWRRLPPDLQRLLSESQAYWEDQLSAEVIAAEEAGLKFGIETGIKTIAFDGAEQRRFDQLYNQVSLETAAKTAPSYGAAMFHSAQAAIVNIRAGRPAC
ncbi:MAG: TRAP transporter substrate-binding protein DctP, partial [Caulobacteraceae bacterium]